MTPGIRQSPMIAGLGCALLAAVLPAVAASPTVTSMTDAAGGGSTHARYALRASLGSLGGASHSAAGRVLARSGFLLWLPEVRELTLQASVVEVTEGGLVQVTGTAREGDDSQTLLRAGQLCWFGPPGLEPELPDAQSLRAPQVFRDEPWLLEARFGGARSTLDLVIHNVGDDDFGLYAADGLPDTWQVETFGERNPDGRATADPDGDGQPNVAEYYAGVSPTNAASRFELVLLSLPEEPGRRYLLFAPVRADRTYVLESTDDLSAAFAPLAEATQVDWGDWRMVLDERPAAPTRFYRVTIRRE